jgi:S1-C subfamily serine protease
VDTYRETWDRLAKGEIWGGGFFGGGAPTNNAYLGVVPDPDAESFKILEVKKDSPADQAGLKIDDVILTFDSQKIANFDEMAAQLRKKKPGDTVTLEVQRGKEKLKLEVKLGKRE